MPGVENRLELWGRLDDTIRRCGPRFGGFLPEHRLVRRLRKAIADSEFGRQAGKGKEQKAK